MLANVCRFPEFQLKMLIGFRKYSKKVEKLKYNFKFQELVASRDNIN